MWGGSGFPKKYQGHEDLKYQFCKVSDMNLPGNETVIQRTIHTISEVMASEMKAKILPKGTLIFPKIGGQLRLTNEGS